MSHASKYRLGWAHDSFWNVMKKGLLLLEKEPMCDFQTGKQPLLDQLRYCPQAKASTASTTVQDAC